jgi:TetR/AcrR family transcriptional regulator, tetracycline repressor protein
MPEISRTQIVEAALELLDRDGLAGVTTRRIADRLGIRSASLYWHIHDREELLDLLSERIVASARFPDPSAGWRKQVESLMEEFLRCLLEHRDGARVVAGRPPMGRVRLRGAEMLLRALTDAGLSDQQAIDAGLVLTTYVVGFALEQQAPVDSTGPEIDEAFAAEYPTLARLAPIATTGPDLLERFREGMVFVLSGIEARTAGLE